MKLSEKISVPQELMAMANSINVLVLTGYKPDLATKINISDFPDRQALREALIKENLEKISRYYEETKVLQKIEAISPITENQNLFATLRLSATPHQIQQLAELDDVKAICWGDQPVTLIEPVKH